MSNLTAALPVVTATALPGGFTRYEADGEVVTAKSRRTYTHASVYVRVNDGDRDGELAVFLHARADLAMKGNPDANRIPCWRRVPGAVEIQS